jgi:hypothetical protein
VVVIKGVETGGGDVTEGNALSCTLEPTRADKCTKKSGCDSDSANCEYKSRDLLLHETALREQRRIPWYEIQSTPPIQ